MATDQQQRGIAGARTMMRVLLGLAVIVVGATACASETGNSPLPPEPNAVPTASGPSSAPDDSVVVAVLAPTIESEPVVSAPVVSAPVVSAPAVLPTDPAAVADEAAGIMIAQTDSGAFVAVALPPLPARSAASNTGG